MGEGFSILTWDMWGSGLVRVNPSLVTDGTKDIYGNPVNWWLYKTPEERANKINELIKGLVNWMVIE